MKKSALHSMYVLIEKNTNKVFLYEIYQDKDAFDYHLKSDHYLSFDKDVKNWVTKKTVDQLIKQN